MTRHAAVLVSIAVSIVLLAAGAATAGDASRGKPASDEQRAEAMLGLARIASAQGHWQQAHERFAQSCRLRACSPSVLLERFWVAAHVDSAAAIGMASELAAQGRASRDVFTTSVSLIRATGDDGAALLLLDRAARAYPADPTWARLRADIALQAEREMRMAVAAEAWSRVPATQRTADAQWQASYLRVSAAGMSRARVAPELDAFVTSHPGDAGMRRMAIEAWADAGHPLRALDLYAPLLGSDAPASDLRRAADLARQGGAASRARALLSRLVSSPAARADDAWALAEVLAAEHDSTALRQLLSTRRPDEDACAARLVRIVTASGDDALLADLVPELSPTCASYLTVAGRVAGVLVARGRAADAERWLEPLRRTQRLDAEGRLTLARALAARRAWPAMDDVLGPLVADPADDRSKAAASMLAWAWHAQGRSTEAWALAERLADPGGDTAEGKAGWAAMALAAGEFAAAEDLADDALGSPRDVDARAIHAALAERTDRPGDVRRWLDPVVSTLTDPGHVLLWLDAVETLDGPRVATREAEHFDAIIATSPALLTRRAAWAAALGDPTSAATDVAVIRGIDAEAAERAAIVVSLAAGDGEDAWARVTAASSRPGTAGEEWNRLRLDAALVSRHWDAARRQLDELGGDLTDAERALAEARLALGRDGQLTSVHRRDLEQLVGAGRSERAALVLLARDEVAGRRYDAALSRLGIESSDATRTAQPVYATRAEQPPDVRAVAAEALLGLGRGHDVLALTAGSAYEPTDLRVLRARAMVMTGQAAEGRAELERQARTTGRVDVYRAWAEAVEAPDRRVVVLAEALSRHPADQDLRVRHADALRRAGSVAAAVAEAEAIVRVSPDARDAWLVLVAAGTGSPAERVHVLTQARTAVGSDPDGVVALVEAVTESAALPGEVVDLAAAWLRDVPPTHVLRAARAEAILAVGASRWPMARAAVARVRTLAPDDLAARRFEAEITAWSGEHAEAESLFATYLALVPDDVAAWRQYARVLSWRNDRDGAERAYARARALSPAPGLEAEARTRVAVLRRAWPEAAAAASSWRTLEPTTLDAVVDLALARELAGDATGAAQAYADLARWPQLPDTVRRTLDAYAWRQGPHGTGMVEVERSEGFGGQRLVARQELAVAGDVALSDGGRWRIQGRIGQGSLDTGATDYALTQGQAGLRASFGPALTADAHLGAARVGGDDLVLAGVTVQHQLSRHVALEASTARKPFWENDETVHAGMQAWASGLRLRLLAAGRVEASAGIDYSVLSDGVRRQQVDASIAHQMGSGPRLFEVRASAFVFGYSETTTAYFSPSAFGRIDVEAGLTRWVGRGAAVRDGRFALRGRIGTGVDSDGIPYLLSGAGVVVPIGGRLGLVGDARFTGSTTYRGWSASLGIQVGGSRSGGRNR